MGNWAVPKQVRNRFNSMNRSNISLNLLSQVYRYIHLHLIFYVTIDTENILILLKGLTLMEKDMHPSSQKKFHSTFQTTSPGKSGS